MHRIYETALRLLANLGIGAVPDRLLKDLCSIGAHDNGEGRVLFPPEVVKSAVKTAAKSFTFHGRDPTRSIEVGGQNVYFGTGGAAVQTLNLETQAYRP